VCQGMWVFTNTGCIHLGKFLARVGRRFVLKYVANRDRHTLCELITMRILSKRRGGRELEAAVKLLQRQSGVTWQRLRAGSNVIDTSVDSPDRDDDALRESGSDRQPALRKRRSGKRARSTLHSHDLRRIARIAVGDDCRSAKRRSSAERALFDPKRNRKQHVINQLDDLAGQRVFPFPETGHRIDVSDAEW